jgi:translation factor GUF1, mitochondrial
VFVGAFPLDSDDFNKMADSIEKLALNDRSLSIQRESSVALGQGIFFLSDTIWFSGFRMGFLGYLHVGITVDRLRQEYGSEVISSPWCAHMYQQIIVTAPTVPYKVVHRDGTTEIISNPAEFPDPHQQSAKGSKLFEPMVDATMIFPSEYLGDVIELCEVCVIRICY